MYVTIAEADAYIAAHYLPTDPLRVAWESLIDEYKQVLLTRSYDAIEMLPLRGRKASCGQQTAFPRWPDTAVPECVKSAQIENALELGNPSEEAEEYMRMRQLGVTEYKIGNLSEKLGGGSADSNLMLSSGIVSFKAMQLLRPFLSGPFNIRG